MYPLAELPSVAPSHTPRTKFSSATLIRRKATLGSSASKGMKGGRCMQKLTSY
jgi:hypothetical protein